MIWLDVTMRAFLFVVVLFLITKLLGKKQLAELSYFEYISGITIGSVAGEAIMSVESKVLHGVLGIVVFGGIPFVVGLLSLKSKTLRDLIDGKGTIFIKDGKIMEDNLKKEKYSTDELLQLLRGKDVFQVDDVEYAILEPNGDLSVLLKKENRPMTLKDYGIKKPKEKEPYTVIMDGEFLDDPLSSIGKSRMWIHTELDKMGIAMENVFLGQVDSYGQLTVDLYDDKIQVPSPQEKPLLLATMKKCQADFELFALSTDSEEAKQMYHKNGRKMAQSIEKLTPYLKE